MTADTDSALATRSPMRQALKASAALHLVVISAALSLSWLIAVLSPSHREIKISVIEVPPANTNPAPQKPVVEVKAPPKPIKEKVRAVFGLSRDAHTDDKSTVEVKAGNTLAKAIDQEKLDPNDPTRLPVPAEEYLVTQMPKLQHEVRIAYPPEAKSKNIEGAVVMDVLIDDKGKVRSAQLVTGPGFGLNEAALQAIYSFEFAPALIDSKPVAVRIRYAYRFVLN